MNISSAKPHLNPATTCDFGASARNSVSSAEADPSKGCTFGPRDSVSSAAQEDLGLITPDMAPKETLGDRLAFGAGMGALIGGIAPGIAIPFVGFALSPFTMVAGGLAGAAIAACVGE